MFCFYLVSLNVGKLIAKTYYPRKLDYLKSGFGKCAFLKLTVTLMLAAEILIASSG